MLADQLRRARELEIARTAQDNATFAYEAAQMTCERACRAERAAWRRLRLAQRRVEEAAQAFAAKPGRDGR